MTGLKDISRQKNYTRKASRTVIIFAELSDVGIKASVLYMTNDLSLSAYTPDYYSTTVIEMHSTSPTAHLLH